MNLNSKRLNQPETQAKPMSDQLQTILDLKTKAKNRRDRGRYKIAVSILDEAIALSTQGLNSTKTAAARKSQFAKHLSDCFGMQGGIYRRWGLEVADEQPASAEQKRGEYLAKSIKAYGEGFSYESNDAYGIIDSYNLVNRLVSRILYDPTWLTNELPQLHALAAGEKPLNMKTELERAKKIIAKQLKLPRRGDPWALADQALVTMLLGQGDPASAYADLIAVSPPDYVYGSAIAALEPLAGLELTVTLNSEIVNVTDNLKKALRLLNARLEGIQH